MNIKDYFNIAAKNIVRGDKNKFYIIIIVILAVLTLGIQIFRINFNNFLEASYTKNIGFRSLVLKPKPELKDLGKSELLGIDHVDDVYSSAYGFKGGYTDFKNDNLNGYVELLYGSIKTLPAIIKGRTFKEKERNVAICPINFYPDDSVYSLNIKDKYIIDGNKLLSKSFTIKYLNYVSKNDESSENSEQEELTKSFEIVGLYNNEQTINFNNQCFIPAIDIIEMIDGKSKQTVKENNDSYWSFTVIVDNLNNIDKVIRKAKNLGYERIRVQNQIDVKLVNTVEIACTLVLVVVLFAVILLTSSYIKKKILNETKIIGILRACGYRSTNTTIMYLCETFFIHLFSFIIGFILFLIIYIIAKIKFFDKFAYIGIDISINWVAVLISIIIIILIPSIITIYYISQRNRLNIVKLIGDDE